MLWLILGGLASFAAGFLLFGFLRRPGARAARAEHDLEVYRSQLKELDRERESNLISSSEAEAAKIEIQRRILAAGQAPKATSLAPGSRLGAGIQAAVVVLVPLAAFGLYFFLGNPGVPSVPFADRPPQSAAMPQARDALPDVETMIARVRARLTEDPGDLTGWTLLGRSLASLGRYPEAIEAFDQAIRLSDADAGLYGAKAETMIAAAQGSVTPEARAVLEQALSLDPKDARTRFYLAAAKQQAGDTQAALDDLRGLLAEAPGDASWYDAVHRQAAGLATDLGLDPEAILPKARLDEADPRAAAARLAARLEQDPKDFRGWIDLARIRAGQGDSEGARGALDRGAEVYEGAPFVQQQFRQAATELGLTGAADQGSARGPSRADMEAASEMTPDQQQAMIRSMVGGLAERLETAPDDLQGWQMLARSYGVLGERDQAAEAYRHVLTLDSTNTDALFFLGEAASAKGDKKGAAKFWTRLLARLTPGGAEHTMVRERLNALGVAP